MSASISNNRKKRENNLSEAEASEMKENQVAYLVSKQCEKSAKISIIGKKKISAEESEENNRR
jgi:hypothetical protein